jgi:transcriptional regulator with XRE-family HTH domain
MIRDMTDERVGRFLVAVRRHLGLRQLDVAVAARVDQTVVSRIERGELARVSVAAFRSVCRALGVESSVDLRWRGGLGDRLVDQDHARLVEAAVAMLERAGWIIVPEYTFNVFGERGSVDILAWHPLHRALLIVEVKTRLTDLQRLLMSMSRKVRLVPPAVAKDRGWDRRSLGIVVLVADTKGNRSTAAAHRATFDATFPSGSRAVRAWLQSPTGDVAGLWFTALRRQVPADRDLRQRVRVRHSAATRAPSGPQATDA